MNKVTHSRHRHGPPDSDSDHPGFHRPYRKNAHHDWRLIVAVSLMLVAVFIYVTSDDLTWRPHSQPWQSLSDAVK